MLSPLYISLCLFFFFQEHEFERHNYFACICLKQTQTQRHKALLSAINSNRYPSIEILEAVENLANLKTYDRETCVFLLEAVLQGDRAAPLYSSRRFNDALASTGAVGASVISDYIKKELPTKGVNDSKFFPLFRALGQMEQSATLVCPFLKEMLNNKMVSIETKIRLHLAIASIEGPRGLSEMLIIGDLGDRRTSDLTLSLIVEYGTRNWFTPKIVENIKKIALSNEGNNGELEKAIEVCLLGCLVKLKPDEIKKSIDLIKSEQIKTISTGDYLAIFYSFILAKIDPTQAKKYLLKVLAELDMSGKGDSHYFSFLSEVTYVYMDANISLILGELVGDRRPKVFNSSGELLLFSGLHSKGALQPLINILRQGGKEDNLSKAVQILERIIPWDCIQKLDELAEIEKNSDVKQKIKAISQNIKNKQLWKILYGKS